MAKLFLTTFIVLPPLMVAQAGGPLPPDMGCLEGPRKAEWASVKKRLRSLFDGAKGPFQQVSDDDLVAAVKGSIADMEAVGGFSTTSDAVKECGFGKLFIQLLGLATLEDPAALAQYFQDHPDAASPVLTMLLDIPWVVMAQTGWPFLGILTQINLQKAKLLAPMLEMKAVDGLENEAVVAYYDVMKEAQSNNDMMSMATASNMFLRNVPPGSPYASLTALATQAALEMNIQERLKALKTLQDLFKQMVTTPNELDIALTVRWPLWGFLHAAVDVFADV
jgi:hypothetical protein